MTQSILKDKSKAFARRMVRLADYIELSLVNKILINQLLRSGTSICANIYEAFYGQSRLDFISKLSISLKEASETELWIDLLFETERLTEKQYASLKTDLTELMRLLTASINTAKKKIKEAKNSKKDSVINEPSAFYQRATSDIDNLDDFLILDEDLELDEIELDLGDLYNDNSDCKSSDIEF